MKQAAFELQIKTRGRGFHEITGDIRDWIAEGGFGIGLLVLHIRHTSASLLIQENADPEVRRDLERFFSRLIPDGDTLFRHTMEGDDDMPAHVRTALTAVNLTIPVQHGEMTLGTWQGIYVWEHRTHPHTRSVNLHFIGE